MNEKAYGDLERAHDELGIIDNALAGFLEEHEDIFATFDSMVSARNDAIDRVATAMREADFPGQKLDYGAFQAVKRMTRGYDPTALLKSCPQVFGLPGIVKSIDKKVLEAAVREGYVAAADVHGAYYEKEGTVAVTGPKKFLIDVGQFRSE